MRETSVKGLVNPKRYLSLGAGSKTADEVRRDFKDIILQEELHNSVRALAAAAANTKRHGAPFRHMLFYGPPGETVARPGCSAAAFGRLTCALCKTDFVLQLLGWRVHARGRT